MKRFFVVLLIICIIICSLGSVTVLGASSAGAGSSSSGSLSASLPSKLLVAGYATDVSAELNCDTILSTDGKFYSGNMEFCGNINIESDAEKEVFVAIAVYDVNGALADISLSVSTVSAFDGDFSAKISNVNTCGTVRCMVIDAVSLIPLCKSLEYVACSDTLKFDLSWIDFSDSTQLYKNYLDFYPSDDAIKSERINISSDVEIYVNGVEGNVIEYFKYYEFCDGTIEFAETTDDAFVDRIDITVYEHGIVSEVDLKRGIIFCGNNTRLIFDDSDNVDIEIYNAAGKEMSIEDVCIGDTLAMVVGELDINSTPVPAKMCREKITIYNLGNTAIEGEITSVNYDTGDIGIDTVKYKWAHNYGTDATLSDMEVGRIGLFYRGIDGKIIGASLYRDCAYGFVIGLSVDTSGFEDSYQLKLLTENDGVVIYNVDSNLNNEDGYDIESLQYYFGSDEYDNTNDSDDIEKTLGRMVQFQLNKNGEIDEISMLYDLYRRKCRDVEGQYAAMYNILDGYDVCDDLIVFNVADNEILNLSDLADEAPYTGYVMQDAYSDCYNIFVMTSGLLADEVPSQEKLGDIGFVLESSLSDNDYENVYQMMLLTKDDGRVTYNVAPRCSVNGYTIKAEEQGEYIDIALYDNSVSDAAERVVEYELNSSGEISKIDFVHKNNTFDSVNKKEDFGLSYKVTIFDVSYKDVYNCISTSGSYMVDFSWYAGVASCANYFGKYRVLVITDRELEFNTEYAKIFDSMEATQYNGKPAMLVNYYEDGESELHSVYITDESECIGDSYDVSDMTRGSMFEATVDKNGLVLSYAVFVVVNTETLEFEFDGLSDTAREVFGDEYGGKWGVNFICGYYTDYNSGELCIGDTFVYCPSQITAQYTYHKPESDNKIIIGIFDYYVDEYCDGEGYMVLARTCEGEVMDIISIGSPKNITEEEAYQLVYSTQD